MAKSTLCFLCSAPLEARDDGVQLHPDVPDCEVRFTDAWGVPIAEPKVVEQFEPIDIRTYPSVDDVLAELFAKAGLARLGGQSTGRGWSSVSTFQRCPYAWNRRYRLQLKPSLLIESPSLAIGSMVHTFLASYYMLMIDPSYALTPEVIYDVTKQFANPVFIEESWRVFTAYRLFYSLEVIQPLAIEHDLKDPRTGESCRYDLIAYFPESVAGRAPGTYVIEHKCLMAKEKIRDQATGKLWAIEDLHACRVAPTVLGLDEDTGEISPMQASIPWPTTVRDVYETVLRSGRRLRTSENHPFLTARGWIPAASLTADDWVAVPRTTAGYDGPSAFSDEEVEFIGLMLGDGTLSANGFTKSVGPVLDRFLAIAQALGYHEGGGGADSYRIDADHRSAPTVHLSQASTSRGRVLLEDLGLWGHLAAGKFVPDALLAIPDRQIGVLLSGLWNTDGCVDLFEERRNGSSQMKVRIAYVSRSHALCDGVQELLHRLGVPSTVTESSVEYDGARREVWTTKVVTREGKRRFLMLAREGRISFLKYPIDAAFDAIKPGDDTPIPSDLIRRMVPDDELTGILRSQVKTYRSVQRLFLAEHGAKKQSAAIARLLRSDVTWERVSHVVISGRAMMYDITVSGAHNFVANGIITHNTASRFDGDTLEGWVNDGEVIGQVALWKRLGLDLRFGKLQGVMVNLLGKHKVPQFHRTVVGPDSWQVDAHLDDLRRWEGLMQLCISADSFPRARQGCISRYGRCSYFDHCAGAE